MDSKQVACQLPEASVGSTFSVGMRTVRGARPWPRSPPCEPARGPVHFPTADTKRTSSRLRGNGDGGSLGLEVAAGYGAVTGNPEDSDVTPQGPLVSAGLRWRVARSRGAGPVVQPGGAEAPQVYSARIDHRPEAHLAGPFPGMARFMR